MKVFWCAILACRLASAQADADLDALYKQHKWFDLRDALQRHRNAPALYRGAVAVAFADQETAERVLVPISNDGSDPDAAYDAHQWLTYLFVRAGQYRRAAAEMEKKWALAPEEAVDANQKALATAFGDLPDQTLSRREPSSLSCRPEQPTCFVPVAVNDRQGSYFFDSDASLSFLSESEARRLGLTIRGANATIHGAGGKEASFRFAVAGELTLGGLQLKNVAFAVLSDSEALFLGLPAGKRGALGLPVMIALQTIGWTSRDRVQLSYPSSSVSPEQNLCFDGPDPVTRFRFGDQNFESVMDTGAETTEIWPPFAKRLSEYIDRYGRQSLRVLHAFGAAETRQERTIRDFPLEVGGKRLLLRPAHVLLATTTPGSEYYFGRLGLDILHQAREVDIDFKALRLSLR